MNWRLKEQIPVVILIAGIAGTAVFYGWWACNLVSMVAPAIGASIRGLK